MPLASGTRLGPYEILASLGAGGMGEVYRARDTRLKRDVALKVLPQNFAGDPHRMLRFQREAEVLASLNHPNIAHIYGVEAQALVMELVEGQSPRGPMPFEDAWKIASQMARGLEYAHDKGVVHRDLKPANVMVTPEGTVKLLDFGLAKAFREPAGSAEGDPSLSPTVTMDATVAGTIMGTPAYMSPEQAKGKPVDKRADIWSWGVVLCELLTGASPFRGENPADTLAAVIHKQPDLRMPPQARKLLERCLEKDPSKRLRDIGDAEDLLEAGVQPAPITRSWPGLSVAIIALLIVALAALAFVHFRERRETRPVLQYTVAPPEKARNVSSFAISPDAHYLAMAASGDGEPQIWVRSLDSLETQALAGTEGGAFPFWSPDSRYLGFFSQGKLKKISVTGGTPQVLCDATGFLGGAWSRDGVIVFGRGGGLSRVPEAGGVPVGVTDAGATTHRWPVFLPDGKRLLYLSPRSGAQSGIDLTSLDDPKQTRRLTPDITNPQYVAPQPGSAVGYLLFVRGGTLMAQPVDPKTMDNRGELFPVAQQVSRGVLYGTNLYSVSANGTLVYLNRGGAGATTQHVWLDRAGNEVEKVGGPMRSRNTFALSPDGKRVVVERMGGDEANSDLWLLDLEHGVPETRLTFDASTNYYPVWSPDGAKIAFASNRNGGIFNLYQHASNGTGQDELLFQSKDPTKFPWDWSHDGKFLLFRAQGSKNGLDLWALPVVGPGEKKPLLVLNSPFLQTQGQFSPDGRWLAYTSNESGSTQVYVAPFAPAFDKPIAGKWQISPAGGTQPRWRGDGKELYYVAPDRKLMAVEVKATALSFDRAAPQPLFELRSYIEANNALLWGYVPRADGKRFLVAEIPGANGNAPPPPMTVVVNWLGSVKK